MLIVLLHPLLADFGGLRFVGKFFRLRLKSAQIGKKLNQMTKKLIMANWKLNPTSEVEAIKLAKAEDFKNVIIAPPFPFLKSVGGFIRNADLGAQDVVWKE